MKKLILFFSMLLLFVSGCSSSGGGSDDTSSSSSPTIENNETNTTDENTTTEQHSQIDNNQKEENKQKKDDEKTTNNSENNESNATKENNITCGQGEKLDDNGSCVKDENVTAVTSGRVVDGSIFDANVSVCKIWNNTRSESNESTCSTTDTTGKFQCAVREDEYDYLIFKATGGTDLGTNSDSRDDKPNVDVLKSIASKNDIDQNKSFMVSPATTLVVLRASQSDWNVSEAKESIAKALGTTSDQLFDISEGEKYGTIVANIVDSLGKDIDRAEILSKLSQQDAIYSDDGSVIKELLPKLDPSISETNSETLANLIVESVKKPSDVVEKVIDQVAEQIDENRTITNEVVESYKTILENNFTLLDDKDVRNLVSDAVVKGVADINNSLDVALAINQVLEKSEDKKVAISVLSENIEQGNNLIDIESIINQVQRTIAMSKCQENEIFDEDEGICKVAQQKVPKDAVKSPEDIPALPDQGAKVIEESSFPQIPSENDYSSKEGLDTQPGQPADNNYPSYEQNSSRDDQTTPYQTN